MILEVFQSWWFYGTGVFITRFFVKNPKRGSILAFMKKIDSIPAETEMPLWLLYSELCTGMAVEVCLHQLFFADPSSPHLSLIPLWILPSGCSAQELSGSSGRGHTPQQRGFRSYCVLLHVVSSHLCSTVVLGQGNIISWLCWLVKKLSFFLFWSYPCFVCKEYFYH